MISDIGDRRPETGAVVGEVVSGRTSEWMS